MLDLGPASREMARLVAGVRDEQLTAPTPCDCTIGDMLDHVYGFSWAFTAAATREPIPGGAQPPSADASRLPPDWRTAIPSRVGSLADAWRDEQAWQGMTQAGGADLPAEQAGVVALDELVIHGWDIAVASGQPFEVDPASIAACTAFVSAVSGPDQVEARKGLFGPVVEVPVDASELDRLLGLAGRDPGWSAS